MSLPIIERATYTIFLPPEHRVIPILSDAKKTHPMKGKFFQSRHIPIVTPRVLTMQRRKSTIHDCVSIHAPLARHDFFYRQTKNAHSVSIHVPLTRHDAKVLFPSHFCLHLWGYTPTDTLYAY